MTALALAVAGCERPVRPLLPEEVSVLAETVSGEPVSLLVSLQRNARDLVDVRVAEGAQVYDGRRVWRLERAEDGSVSIADRVIGLLNTQGVKPVQLVLNRVRPKMMANQEMLSVDDVTDILALPLLGLVLEDEQVIVSTNRGEPLTLNGNGSPAARAYRNVARRLRGEEVPILDPSKERRGLRARLFNKLGLAGA